MINSIDVETGFATLVTEEKVPIQIKEKAMNLKKIFEVGESVRILQGIHAGESGVVTDLQKLEGTHA